MLGRGGSFETIPHGSFSGWIINARNPEWQTGSYRGYEKSSYYAAPCGSRIAVLNGFVPMETLAATQAAAVRSECSKLPPEDKSELETSFLNRLKQPGAKDDGGKPIAGVLLDFSRALEAVVEVGTHGSQKYSRGGWQHVPDGIQRYVDAMMRHLLACKREESDPDSGLTHAAHIAWNVLAVLELQLRAKE